MSIVAIGYWCLVIGHLLVPALLAETHSPMSFKSLLASGQLCRIFCSGRIIHPVVFDVHGMCGGFHGIWLDQEHCGVSYEQVVLAAACCRANGMDSFVRMAMTNYS